MGDYKIVVNLYMIPSCFADWQLQVVDGNIWISPSPDPWSLYSSSSTDFQAIFLKKRIIWWNFIHDTYTQSQLGVKEHYISFDGFQFPTSLWKLAQSQVHGKHLILQSCTSRWVDASIKHKLTISVTFLRLLIW
jgi:hypothetical protein